VTKEIRTEIHIAASAARVWAILTDLAAFPDWNPLVLEGSGELRPGARLRLRIRSGRELRVRPLVLAARPERELRWRGELLHPWLFAGEHYFLLEPDPKGTRLVHGERFSGVLVGLVGRMLDAHAARDFAAMNQALRRRAEAS
jgi:hypothetical protein